VTNISQLLWNEIKDFDHIIWDWNGTLLNDLDVVIDIITQFMNNSNMKPPTTEEYKEAFGFPVINFYKKLGFSTEDHSYKAISEFFHSQYDKRSSDSSLFKGAKELLSFAKSNDKKQSILSAASQIHLDKVVKQFGIHELFENIYGLPNNDADSKVNRGHELISISDTPKDKTIMIGDTDHDCEVAKSLGIHSLLIADGHQSYERLTQIHNKVLRSRF